MKEDPGLKKLLLCVCVEVFFFLCVLVWITPLAALFSLRINSLQKEEIPLDNKFVQGSGAFGIVRHTGKNFFLEQAHWEVFFFF